MYAFGCVLCTLKSFNKMAHPVIIHIGLSNWTHCEFSTGSLNNVHEKAKAGWADDNAEVVRIVEVCAAIASLVRATI